MDRPEYVRIKMDDTTAEFIEKYGLLDFTNNVWVYFEMVRICYGLPQSGNLANDLPRTKLNKEGYFEAATTLALWKHTWRPIQFPLILDDFGIEYVGKKHAQHIRQVLQEHYVILEDWQGGKYQAIIWRGIVPPSTMAAPADSQCTTTLRNHFSALATSSHIRLSSIPISIARFTM